MGDRSLLPASMERRKTSLRSPQSLSECPKAIKRLSRDYNPIGQLSLVVTTRRLFRYRPPYSLSYQLPSASNNINLSSLSFPIKDQAYHPTPRTPIHREPLATPQEKDRPPILPTVTRPTKALVGHTRLITWAYLFFLWAVVGCKDSCGG